MKSMEVKITNLAPFYALGVEHRGAYTGIGQAFGALCGLLAQNHIPLGRTVGIYYDDPSETPEAELRSFAGLAIDAPHEGTAEGLTQVSLVGGKYAVAKFVGEYSKLSEAWNWMMGLGCKNPASKPTRATTSSSICTTTKQTQPLASPKFASR